jgi:hypothetical protein
MNTTQAALAIGALIGMMGLTALSAIAYQLGRFSVRRKARKEAN